MSGWPGAKPSFDTLPARAYKPESENHSAQSLVYPFFFLGGGGRGRFARTWGILPEMLAFGALDVALCAVAVGRPTVCTGLNPGTAGCGGALVGVDAPLNTGVGRNAMGLMTALPWNNKLDNCIDH